MKIKFRSVADLRDYFGRDPVEMELPDEATLQTVLEVISTRWGAVLPEYMWNSKEVCFRGPILLLVDKKVVQDYSFRLKEGQEVTAMKALAGG